jgi:hypothetical protein
MQTYITTQAKEKNIQTKPNRNTKESCDADTYMWIKFGDWDTCEFA